MTAWSDIARQTIERVALSIPEQTPLAERRKLIEAHYPFDMRAYWPRRAWLKQRKAYLLRFEPPRSTPLFPNLERDPISGRPVIK